jgi:hypothetical protein
MKNTRSSIPRDVISVRCVAQLVLAVAAKQSSAEALTESYTALGYASCAPRGGVKSHTSSILPHRIIVKESTCAAYNTSASLSYPLCTLLLTETMCPDVVSKGCILLARFQDP